MKTTAAAFAAVLLFACVVWGQGHPAGPDGQAPAASGAPSIAHADDPAPHPRLPDPSERWPGTVVIVILSMFLAAAIVGPIVRANMPEEVPPAHSHDEPPGTSHHHGKSGTLNPEPDYGHADQGHADHGHH